MSSTPDWMRGEPEAKPREDRVSILGIMAWIAAIAIIADLLFVAQRYLG